MRSKNKISRFPLTVETPRSKLQGISILKVKNMIVFAR